MACRFPAQSGNPSTAARPAEREEEEEEDEGEGETSIHSTKKNSGVSGGGRGAKQVLACSLVAVLCAMARRLWVGPDSALDVTTMTMTGAAAGGGSGGGGINSLGNRLTLAYVAFFACCAGDTWASEIGILSPWSPRLITRPWKRVPPGTNGGMSFLGTVASAVGGTLMGLVHSLGRYSSMTETIVLCTVGFLAGLGGSLLDSWLGATLQATYYDFDRNMIVPRKMKSSSSSSDDNNDDTTTQQQVGGWKFAFLSNEAVNVVSSTLTALLAALGCRFILETIAS